MGELCFLSADKKCRYDQMARNYDLNEVTPSFIIIKYILLSPATSTEYAKVSKV